MATSLTVINDLPKFRGNATHNEFDTFVQGINVKTFFRSLDNHFEQNKITDNAAKLRLLFAQIYTNTEMMQAIRLSITTKIQLSDNENDTMSCADVLQNFCMHLFLSTQLKNEIYDRLAKMNPSHPQLVLRPKPCRWPKKTNC